MKVSELIEKLQSVDSDSKVVISQDEEGNGFHELFDVDTDMRWSGELDDHPRYTELTDELKAAGYTDDDIADEDDGEKVVLLWP